MQSSASPLPEPRVVLSRAAAWIGRLGAALIFLGAIAAVLADVMSATLPTLKMILAILVWVVPGGVYLLTARGLVRRRRWAVTSAEVTTYAQMGIAGLLILISLLFLKVLWPLIVIAAVWLVILTQTPRRLRGISEAMDQLAARVRD